MHLAEGGGGGGLQVEGAEAALPVEAELGHHAPLDEGGPHGRRLRLQLLQFGGVFRRHEIRDGGEELRHLHDRTLQAAEHLRQGGRVAGLLPLEAEQARAGDARGDAADIGADARIARGAGGEAVGFAVVVGHGWGAWAGSDPKWGVRQALSRCYEVGQLSRIQRVRPSSSIWLAARAPKLPLMNGFDLLPIGP